jgi:hypothetical protein
LQQAEIEGNKENLKKILVEFVEMKKGILYKGIS